MSRKAVLAKLEYSTDYDGVLANVATATFTEIPVPKVLQDQAQLFQEEEVTADGIAGHVLGAAVRGSAMYPVIVDDTDTFMADVKAAAASNDPVWFRETLQGQDPIIVGGGGGCTVGVRRVHGQFGGFTTDVIRASSPGANTGDTYQLETGV